MALRRKFTPTRGEEGTTEAQIQQRILVALECSAQSVDTVRYIGGLFKGGLAKITLFHMLDLHPESFLDLKSGQNDPRYDSTGVREWEFEQRRMARAFMDKAVRILVGAGYSAAEVAVVVKDRVFDLSRDLAQEGRRGYDALVLGRSAINLMGGMILENVATRLIGQLNRLPVWVVGGKPNTSKIVIAMDCSRGARNALDYVGKMFLKVFPSVLLLHIGRKGGMIDPELRPFFAVHESRDWMERSKADHEVGNRGMESFLDRCLEELGELGADRSRIRIKVVHEAKSVPEAILQASLDGDYGTMVLGRRDLSKIEEMIRGRTGNRILQLAREKAVWVVH
ncbi:MAG: universal stress protein [Syntrophobacteraceae bacterium]